MATSPSDSVSEGNEFFDMFYLAISVENILYGIELFLYFKTIRILLARGIHKSSNLFYAIFSSVMVFSVTVFVATQAMFGQKMWLLDSCFPGGPEAYWRKNIAVWYVDLGTTTIIILQLMTDALLIYRCRIVWNSKRVVVVPIMLWLASFPLGVSVDWTTSSPGGDYFTGISTRLSLAYWSISVFLSIILTCMICYRMMRHGRMIQENLGNEYASLYFSIATLVVESVFPYTFSGIIVLVALGVQSPSSVTFVAVYFMMMCISPQMLILRVISGKAWNHDSDDRPGSILIFSPPSEGDSRSQWRNSSVARVHRRRSSNAHLSNGHSKARASDV